MHRTVHGISFVKLLGATAVGSQDALGERHLRLRVRGVCLWMRPAQVGAH